MIFRKIFSCLIPALLFCGGASAQYETSYIPEELTRGSHAVMRDYSIGFECTDKTNATKRQTLVVTVLDKEGDKFAGFGTSIQLNESIKSFSGEVFDAQGNSIRKIRRTDLQFTEEFNDLSNDYRLYYYEPSAPYPYTVKYECEVTIRNGILNYPGFFPMPDAHCAVQYASYSLTLPKELSFHSRNFNTAIQPQKAFDGKSNTYTWEMRNLPAIHREPYSRDVDERSPRIYFSPHDFVYFDYEGCMDSWESYGKWQWQLLDKRNVLPEALKAQVRDMTGKASTPLEKVRILYDYLAATTRYVSIQIGIGGFQPMTAEEVYKNKFGDCKGLTNYMQAMLSECGIDSYYTEIGVGDRHLLADFANPLFTNHAILQVPLGADTLWVECTAPELPLGYTLGSIAGRSALVYKNHTTEIVRVNSYADSLHLLDTEARLDLASDGSLKGRIQRSCHMDRYVSLARFPKLSPMHQVNQLSNSLNIPTATVTGISYTEDKSPRPSSVISYEINAPQLGSKTGERRFIPVTALRKNTLPRLGKSARVLDIYIENGYADRDSIVLGYPQDILVEAIPAPVRFDTKYGSYQLSVLPQGNEVLIKRYFLLRSGTYPSSEYPEFKAFMDAVSKADNGMIILKNN